MQALFPDRDEAGKQLATELLKHKSQWQQPNVDSIVLALPRGGVPVAFQIAKTLGLPLDIIVVRKVGVPRNPELAMGAIASGGIEILNNAVLQELNISAEDFSQVAQRELTELERREQLYRRGRLPLDVNNKNVILVDDGIATGSTMRAAISALKKLRARSITMAVPTASPDTVAELTPEVDRIVCLYTPAYFYAVGAAYQNFSQTSDSEVADLLLRAEDATAAH